MEYTASLFEIMIPSENEQRKQELMDKKGNFLSGLWWEIKAPPCSSPFFSFLLRSHLHNKLEPGDGGSIESSRRGQAGVSPLITQSRLNEAQVSARAEDSSFKVMASS